MTSPIFISLVNQSTQYSDALLPALANALQIQVTRDFYPIWGINAKVFYTPTGKNPTASHWPLVLLDNSDQANALGYHDESTTGAPLGKIFVATTLADGEKVEVTASHEFLEMLGDPYINLAAQDGAVLWAYEMCDMVENDSYDITIPAGWAGAGTAVPVSNFALPSWWQSALPGPYDFLKKLTAPLMLTPGGYMSMLDLNKPSQGWVQINGRMDTAVQKVRARPHVGSRRLLRQIAKADRVRSTYTPGTDAIASACWHACLNASTRRPHEESNSHRG